LLKPQAKVERCNAVTCCIEKNFFGKKLLSSSIVNVAAVSFGGQEVGFFGVDIRDRKHMIYQTTAATD